MPKKTTKTTIIWADVHAAFLENSCLSDLVSRFGVDPKVLRAHAKKEKWYEELQMSGRFDAKVIRLNVDRSAARLEGFPKGLYPLWVEPLKRWAKTGETVGIGVTERLAEVISQKVDPKVKALHEKSVRDAEKALKDAAAEAEKALKDAEKLKLKKHIVTQADLDANPDFIKEGIKVGDEIELPEVTE